MQLLQVSDCQSLVLALNPVDCRMAATAGDDGRVNVWDVVAGQLIMSYENTCPADVPSVSCDGCAICCGVCLPV